MNLGGLTSASDEDTSVALNPTIQLTDTDGSETLTGTVDLVFGADDQAAGKVMINGVEAPYTTNADGSITYHLDASLFTLDSSNHTYSLTDAGSVTFAPTGNSDADVTYDLSATTLDHDGSTKTTTGEGTITITAVADSVNLGGLTSASDEDTSVALNPTIQLTDTDGSETLTGTVDLVFGADDQAAGKVMINGVEAPYTTNADGSITYHLDASLFTLDSSNHTYSLTDAGSVTFAPTGNSDADVTYDLSATTLDHDGSTKTTTGEGTITITAVADSVNLGGLTSASDEDTSVALNPTIQLTDTDGSETLTGTVDLVFGADDQAAGKVMINGVEAPYTTNADGSITYHLDASLFTLDSSNHTYSLTDAGSVTFAPTGNSDADVTYDLSATTLDHDGSTKTTTGEGTITITAVADAVVLTASDGGNEDTSVALNPTVQLTDTDGSETLTGTVDLVFGADDQAAGKVMINGVEAPYTTNADGSITYHLDASLFTLDTATHTYSLTDAGSVTFAPTGNSDADVTYDLSATVLDNDGSTKTTTGEGTITITAVADSVNLGGLTSASDEDTSVALNPTIQLTDIDGSETLTGTVDLVFGADDQAAGKVMINGVEAPYTTNADGSITYHLDASLFTLDSSNHTYSLTDAGSVTFAPTGNSDADVTYDLSATTLDHDGSTKTTTGEGTITITAVADAVTLDAQDAAGMEDTAISLNISSGGLVDTDGSETLTIYISDVPAGSVLAQNGTALTAITGSVTLENGTVLSSTSSTVVYAITIHAGESASDALANLTITPPSGVSADFGLTVTAVTEEANGGDQAIVSDTLWVDVGTNAVTLNNLNVNIDEQTVGSDTNWNYLNLDSLTDSLTHADGTETVTVYLSGLPAGSTLQVFDGGSWQTLSADSNGEYAIDDSLLDNLRLSTAVNDSTSFTLTARAVTEDVDVGTAHETASTDAIAPDSAVSNTATITVTVNAVADTAIASGGGTGVEDQWIDLNLSSEVQDTDGSESITGLTLSGVPDGASLQYSGGSLSPSGSTTVGGVTTYTYDLTSLSASELATVQIKSPANSNLDYTLKMETVITESGSVGTSGSASTSVTTTSVSVVVYGDADTPTVTVDESSKTIVEDHLYKLADAVTDPALADTDGSESLVLRITPQDSTNSVLAIDSNHDGVISSSEYVALPASGYWTIAPEDLAYTYIGGSTNWSDEASSLKFDVTAVATEDDASVSTPGLDRDGQASSDTYTVTLQVDGNADALVIVANDAGVEDQSGGIPLSPTFQLTDTDGSESLTGTVDLVFASGTLLVNGVEAPHTDNGDGTVTYHLDVSLFELDSSTNTYSLKDAGSLTYQPVTNSDVDVTYQLSATTLDNNGSTKTTTAEGTIAITAVADAVVLAAADSGNEDTTIALHPTIQLTDTDGSESLTGTVDLVFGADDQAAGKVMVNGVQAPYTTNADGSITYHLSSSLFTYDSSTHTYSLSSSSVVTFVPTANSDVDVTYGLSATVLDHDGSTKTTTGEGTITVIAVADSVVLTASDSGNEDTAIALHPTVKLTDTDGSESLTGTVDMVFDAGDQAAGKVMINGTEAPYTTNADGSITYHLDASLFTYNSSTHTYSLSGSSSVTFVPTANSDVDVSYGLSATVLDHDGSTKTTTSAGSITVVAVADAVTIDGQNAAGMEDTAISLNISSGGLVDTDGSETLTIYISGVPAGSVLAQGGTSLTAMTGSVTLENGTVLTSTSSKVVYAITIHAGESVSDALANLTITPPSGASADFQLTVTAVTTEANGGDQAITSDTLWVDVGTNGIELNDMSVTINERTSSSTYSTLNLNSLTDTLTHSDGTEKVTVYLSGMPSGSILQVKIGSTWTTVNANANGEYAIDDSLLGNVRIATATNVDTDFTLTARAVVADVDVGTSHENAATDAVAPDSAVSNTATITVTVNAVADTAISSGGGTGVEDQWIGLNLSTKLRDTDGSESITGVTLSGVPAGASLQYSGGTLTPSSSSTVGGVTTYTYNLSSLSASELASVQMKAPANSNLDYTLKLNTTITESGSDGEVASGKATSTTSTSVSVVVYGDADTPTVTVDESSKTIVEDHLYKLADAVTNPALHDTDGSETLTLQIAPQDSEHSVLAIDSNHDGVITADEYVSLPASGYWTIAASDLAYTYIGGSTDWSSATASDKLKFDITAVATENDANISTPTLTRDGEASSETYTVTLTVDAEADALVISASNSGVEDQAGGIAITPTIGLQDTDGSETLTDTVYIMTSDSDMLNGTVTLNGTELHAQLVTGYDADGNPTFGGLAAANTPPVYAYSIDADDFSKSGSTYSISGLVFTPVANSDADVTYKIAATVSDNGETLVTVANGTISVAAVADAPTVQVGDGSGSLTASEDTPLALNIDAALVDVDGSETISSAQITNVPDGWTVGYLAADGTFTAATDSGDGVWIIATDKLDQVAILPPTDLDLSSADAVSFQLTVTTTESATGTNVSVKNASTTVAFTVAVDAVADTPTLVVNNARVVEDHDVKLDIDATITDSDSQNGRDPSETVTVYVSGDFDGGILVDRDGNELAWDSTANAYVIAADDLDNVYFRPAADSNTDVTLTITARSTESSNGDYAERSTTLSINIKGDADAATYNGTVLTGDDFSIAGTEGKDGAVVEINPHFDQFGSTDTDGSETVSVVISDIADGVNVYMTPGNEQYLLYIGNGQWAVDSDHLADVRITLDDTNYSGTLEDAFTLKVVVTEDDGDVSETTQSVNLVIDPTTDTQSIALSGGAAEDASVDNGVQVDIPVTITVTPNDVTDGAESITSVTISVDTDSLGLPSGTTLTLTLNGTTYDLTAGETITLDAADLAAYTDANGKVTLPLTMDGLPENWSKDVPVTISTTAIEDGATPVTVTSTQSVVITAVADQLDSFTVTATNEVSNDNSVDLNISATLGDTDGSETISYYQISGVPSGAALNMGVAAGNGVWIVTATQYASGDLHLVGADGLNGTLTITAKIVDTDPDGGSDSTTSSTTVDFSIPAGTGGGGGGTDTPEPPAVTITAVTSAEDTSFTLQADFTNADSSTALVITDLPDGVTINGTLNVDYFIVNDTIVIPADKVDDVSFTPAEDYAGDLSMTVKVTNTWGTSTLESAEATDVVAHITPVSDGASIAATVAAGADTTEDSSGVPFTLTISQSDNDGSEYLDGTTITIDGSSLPAGSVLTLNGVVLTADANGDYVLDITSDFGVSGSAFHDSGSITLSGLSVQPPADWSGTLNLGFSVSVHDESVVDGSLVSASSVTSTGSLSVTITPETDSAVITTADASGAEDTAITLDLTAHDSDLKSAVNEYGSEALSVVISGVPEGATIEGATNNGTYVVDGVTYTSWTVKSSAIDAGSGTISGLKITPAQDWSGTMTLSVTAYTMELSTKVVVSESQTFTVDVAAVSDTATINPQDVTASDNAREEQQIALTLNAQLTDVDGSETLSVKIAGVPSGATFTDGNGNSIGTSLGGGIYLFTAAEVAVLHIVAPVDYSGTLDLTAQAISTDGSAASAESGWMSFSVTVLGQADAPTLTLASTAITGTEDQSGGIALNVTGALTDTTGESLQLLITGAPAGSTFTAADGTVIHETVSATGVSYWAVDGSDISGLVMNAPENWNGTVSLGLELISSEDGTTASTTGTLDVTVTAVNDAPEVDVLTHSSYDNDYNGPVYVIADQADGTSGLTISDVDSTTLSHMDIAITGGLQDGDSLSIYGQTVSVDLDGNLTVTIDGSTLTMSYDASTSTLSFDGDASSSAYQTLAGSVVLTSSTGTLDEGTRTISVTTYDDGGLAGSDSTTTSIQNGSMDLSYENRGDVLFDSGSSVTLLGNDGVDDTLVMNYGDPLTTVDGGTSGFDQLYIMPAADNPSVDWTINAATDSSGNLTGDFTVSGTDGDSFLIHVDPAHVTSVDAHNIVFDQDASGTITFEDHTLNFNDLEKISV
ncbi:hypothetical protein [Insolitispirillum peregrinum]|uniref:hypothetical protein n=2 Tax=Insolitispirillum peregrinum TaxID=80876 RepID=UPI001C37594F|nr:hypothetical protein [Insolitispirillum peregrinum]